MQQVNTSTWVTDLINVCLDNESKRQEAQKSYIYGIDSLGSNSTIG